MTPLERLQVLVAEGLASPEVAGIEVSIVAALLDVVRAGDALFIEHIDDCPAPADADCDCICGVRTLQQTRAKLDALIQERFPE